MDDLSRGVPPARTISTTSPLTGGGNLSANRTISLGTQAANKVLAGPTTGADAAPAFRSLVDDDLPANAVLVGDTDIISAVVSKLRTTTGPATLDVGAVADGDVLVRDGTGIVGAAIADLVSSGFSQLSVQDSATDPTGSLTYTVPGGTLANDEESLLIFGAGVNDDAENISLKFGGTTLVGALIGAGDWIVIGVLTRIGSSSSRFAGAILSDNSGGTIGAEQRTTAAHDLSTDHDLVLAYGAADAGDIISFLSVYKMGGGSGGGGGAAGDITAVTAGTGLTGGGSSGSVSLALDVPVTVARGGTGATTAADARANLGLARDTQALYLPVPALHFDAQNLASITKDGSNKVSQWDDVSGNGRHVTQATGGSQPTYMADAGDGLPGVDFDGAADLLVNSTAGGSITGTRGEVWAVVTIDNVATNASQTAFATCDTASTTRALLCRAVDTDSGVVKAALYWQNNGTADRLRGGTTVAAGTKLFRWRSTGTTSGIYLNGAAETITAFTGTNTGQWASTATARDNFTLGAVKTTSESQWLDGKIRELLVFDGQHLNVEQADLLKESLTEKWAL